MGASRAAVKKRELGITEAVERGDLIDSRKNNL
jgi:hypothetical protein